MSIKHPDLASEQAYLNRIEAAHEEHVRMVSQGPEMAADPEAAGLASAAASSNQVGPHAKRSIKRIRRELEAVLTMLNTDGKSSDRR